MNVVLSLQDDIGNHTPLSQRSRWLAPDQGWGPTSRREAVQAGRAQAPVQHIVGEFMNSHERRQRGVRGQTQVAQQSCGTSEC